MSTSRSAGDRTLTAMIGDAHPTVGVLGVHPASNPTSWLTLPTGRSRRRSVGRLLPASTRNQLVQLGFTLASAPCAHTTPRSLRETPSPRLAAVSRRRRSSRRDV